MGILFLSGTMGLTAQAGLAISSAQSQPETAQSQKEIPSWLPVPEVSSSLPSTSLLAKSVQPVRIQAGANFEPHVSKSTPKVSVDLRSQVSLPITPPDTWQTASPGRAFVAHWHPHGGRFEAVEPEFPFALAQTPTDVFPSGLPSSPTQPTSPPEDAPDGSDPELGTLQLEPITPPSEPFVFLQGQVNYLTSDNVFFELDPTGDSFINPTISLLVTPQLGPNTFFVGSASTGLLRYLNSGAASYDELGFSAGIFQQLDANTYGQFGWDNQQFYRPGFGDQFYNNHNLNLSLGRTDVLLPNLQLNSGYQVSLGFADPDEFSRLVQILGVSLTYDISPAFQTGLAYQLTLADFTRQERYDTYHQILGQLVYRASANTDIRLYGGFSFGRSSQPTVQFNDVIFGVSVDFTVPLF